MKRFLWLFVLILFVSPLCFSAHAEVITTKDPTAGSTIYIAGNPDMYPLEFYNQQTECYEGILPELYNRISKETGLQFSYIAAGSEDRQKALAENFQAEIVSAYHKGDISVEKEIELFTYEKGGSQYTVCIGLTKIIHQDTADLLVKAVEGTNQNTWLSAAMTLTRQTNHTGILVGLMIAACILLVIVTLLVIYLIKKRQQKKAQNQTKMTDPLTGIGNLLYFENCFKHHISEPTRPLYYTAYIAVDIEKIKTYFGNTKAEELQRFAAATITDSLGEQDFAGRIDEGVFVLCFICPDQKRAVDSTTELLNKLNAYRDNYAQENGILFRGGLYPMGKKHTTCETTIFNARQGYLVAEDSGQLLCLCDNTTLEHFSLKGRLQAKIVSALENEEFQVYLQFVLDPKTKRFCGAEVLSRWHSREDGVLLPSNYIEDMKEAGMIDSLDFYILDKTCKILSQWQDTEYRDFYLSCNFTRLTLSSTDFIKRFEEVLQKYHFDRSKLSIELTEDFLAENNDLAFKNIQAIKALGCKVALDDFGSGYTSFADLCDYPIDIIKIDRSILSKAHTDRGNAVMTGMIRMAHALEIAVLCEGIEDENDNHLAVASGCDYIQGFLFSRVLPLENAIEFLEYAQ